jgi:hypothetical protein
MQKITTSLLARFSKPRPRRGNIILLSAFVITMSLGFAAFSIDIGYLAVAKGQLQSAVDAATLAAAMELNPNISQTVVETNVKAAAMEIAELNSVGNNSGLLLDPAIDIELGRRDWNAGTSTFIYSFGPSAVPYNIVRVTGRLDNVWNAETGQTEDRRLPMFFAPAIDHENVTMSVGSVATYQPRDIVLVLDYSGSMNDDTEFKSVGSLGQQTIVDAITTMWHELGDPSYGVMPFTPEYLTVTLPPGSPDVPEVSLTYRGTHVDVTSTASIDRIKLGFAGGGHEDFDNLSGTTGTFSGVATYAGVRIDHVHVWSGGTNDEKVHFDDSAIEEWLELDQVAYPHPSGSWLDFINYVNTDSDVYNAGFKYKYSAMCLINYWNERKPRYSQTPGMSVCTTQPLTAAKNASDVFCDYIVAVEADDKVGLSIYTHTNTDGAILESGLTHNVASVKPLYRNRQAGHYDTLTNIGGGLKVAREELETNGRQDAYRVIVLMTDGVANRPSGSAEQWAIDQANLCKTSKIKIMAIALGLGADEDLMLQLAEITGGRRFIVPGGGTIAEYEAQLMQVFQDIAADRPLKLLPSDL